MDDIVLIFFWSSGLMEDVIIVDFIFYEFKVDYVVLNQKI
jgi:hypothetical protein